MICWLCISCGWEGGRAEKDGAKIVNGLLMKMEQPGRPSSQVDLWQVLGGWFVLAVLQAGHPHRCSVSYTHAFVLFFAF